LAAALADAAGLAAADAGAALGAAELADGAADPPPQAARSVAVPSTAKSLGYLIVLLLPRYFPTVVRAAPGACQIVAVS
jgi:hypothetical protein